MAAAAEDSSASAGDRSKDDSDLNKSGATYKRTRSHPPSAPYKDRIYTSLYRLRYGEYSVCVCVCVCLCVCVCTTHLSWLAGSTLPYCP